MKQMVTQLCGVIMTGLVFFFCIQILLGNRNAFGMAQELVGQFEDAELISENGARLQELVSKPVPQVKLDDRVYHTGERIAIFSCIQVRSAEEEPWRYLTEAEGFCAELLDVTEQSGRSLRRDGPAGDDQVLPAHAAVCDLAEENGEMIFYQAGCYIIRIKVTDPYGKTVVKEAVVPVETG